MRTRLAVSVLLLTLVVFHGSEALYDKKDDVIELTDSNFDTKVTSSESIWIVEFYSPKCGHCVKFAPAYKSAAKALKGIVNVGAVDVSAHGSIGKRFGIRGYPTVKIFTHDKSNPEEFKGQRTAESLAKEGWDAALRVINKRLGKTHDDFTSSDDKESKGDVVVELTEANFEKLVLKSGEPWFVGFFAPWCGHCQRLKPDYESAAKQLKGKVKFGSVDATVHQTLASKYNVRGYPTLYYFGGDKKNPLPYEGGRSTSDMVQYLSAKAMEDLPAPKAEQLIKPEQLNVCKEKQLCIIAALPDLLDCQSKCRKDYIKMMEKAAEKHKTNDWRYFWFPAAGQINFEQTFNLGGTGYPAMIAMNQKKAKYATLRGSFSAEGIHEFLRDVSLGSRSISLQDIASMPDVLSSDPWDGKDGKPQQVEEISLEELFKDEL